jgi:energy-dependent translational throttle protein EttA
MVLGKTTLFKMIMKEEEPTERFFKVGDTVKIGYVDQRHKDVDPKKVYDVLSGGSENIEVRWKIDQCSSLCVVVLTLQELINKKK